MLPNHINGCYHYSWDDVKFIRLIHQSWESKIEGLDYYPHYFPKLGLNQSILKEKSLLNLANDSYKIDGKPWFLAPTSQAVAYPLCYGDAALPLPFKWYQLGPAYRNETKMCQKYIRNREIMFFHQAHALFPNPNDAQSEVKKILVLVKNLLDQLGLPFRLCVRPKDDTFPGAESTYAFDCWMGKPVQVFTVHYLKDNFSRIYRRGDPVYGVCFGFSQRLLGVLKETYKGDLPYVLNLPLALKKDTKISKRMLRCNVLLGQDHGDNVYDLKQKVLKPKEVFFNEIKTIKEQVISKIRLLYEPLLALINPNKYGRALSLDEYSV